MLVRLPSAEGYAAQVPKEQKWLPILNINLNIQIPIPLHLGKPNENFPWHWSIYQFIPGESANHLKLTNSEKCELANDLANFSKSLHKAPTEGAPKGGLHNYYRGCHPSVYDKAARKDINTLAHMIDADKAVKTWEKALNSIWRTTPVWVHGDLAIGNLLIQNRKLCAVIDFGCMAVGDPACDLVMAWTYFDGEARQIFQNALDMEIDVWDRAKGWALWKAAFELVEMKDKKSSDALQKLKIIDDVSL
mgnify:CR=1 FL=1